MDYITRIAFNRAGWRKPTGDAQKYEDKNSYNAMYGFGHEEWLFRDSWTLGGWRYGFLQGVGKSLKALRRANNSFNVRLFCIEPDGRRRFVADIEGVECLDDVQAEWALDEYSRKGWLDQMKSDVRSVGGKVSALGSPKYAPHILNVRFRPDSVHRRPEGSYASAEDPVYALTRYVLTNVAEKRFRYLAEVGGGGKGHLPSSLTPIAGRTPNADRLATDLERVEQRGDIGKTTKQRLMEARIGQGRYRELLLRRWDNACAVTGCGVLRAVRASHALRWSDSSDDERLDPDNGLPLIGTLDALFDAGLIAFELDGSMLVSRQLSAQDRKTLGVPKPLRQKPSAAQWKFLQLHRDLYFLN